MIILSLRIALLMLTKFEARYDVWITGTYNDKVCNEIIKITKWDAWVAGKFLLELENDGDCKETS